MLVRIVILFRAPIHPALEFFFKKHYMQEGPRVKKCPIAIQFLGAYVIVMGVIDSFTMQTLSIQYLEIF